MKNTISIFKIPVFYISIIFGVINFACFANNNNRYYLSNSGNDRNSGTSPENAWKTIKKVNSVDFKPGDSILFEKGSVWRISVDDAIKVNSSGTKENYITYSSYGKGNKPRILGSVKIENWNKLSENIWNASLIKNPKSIGYGSEIFFEINPDSVEWGMYKNYSSDLNELTKEFEWTWDNGTIYIYSENDPNDSYFSIESPQSTKLFYYLNNDYVTVDNFEFAYSASMGICDNYNPGYNPGARITNNTIHHIGFKNSREAYGISMKHSEMYIGHNVIHDCGRRNISINLYKDEQDSILMENVIIEHNRLYNGWHTTGIDGINSGEHIMRNIHIRNNLFEDNKNRIVNYERFNYNTTSNFIYVVADPWSVSYNVFIYNNIFKNGNSKQITLDGVDSVFICNNTFFGFGQNINIRNAQNIVHATDLMNKQNPKGVFWIYNNIFYNDANPKNHPYANCIYIDADCIDLAKDIDYNIYYATPGSSNRLTNVFGKGKIDKTWYATTFNGWINFSGFDKNSPKPSNPMFSDFSKLTLQHGSPAIGKGKPIPWIKTDFYGNTMNNPPDIGAVQFQHN